MLAVENDYEYANIKKDGAFSIGHIPSADDVDKAGIRVTDVEYYEGNGEQLNIVFTYENSSGQKVQSLHEHRYSHGQFNGYPESKAKFRSEGSDVDLVTFFKG